MVHSAQELRDFIKTNWQFDGTTGNLRLSKVPADPAVNPAFLGVMKEIVYFFDRPQVPGNEVPKSVTVRKVTEEGDEGKVVHPNFTETYDIYEIECFYRVQDVISVIYTQALSDMQEMTSEISRILLLRYDPSQKPPIGIFFTTSNDWEIRDREGGAQIDLRRKLRFKLTSILSTEPEVFSGFGGLLIFDASSEGDNPPASDYVYTEVLDVTIEEGFEEIPYLTKDKVFGAGVPQLSRGLFAGTFTAVLQAKAEDLDTTPDDTTNKIPNIYKPQFIASIIGQIPEVIFLNAHGNTETPTPQALQTTSFIKFTRITKTAPDENLVGYRLHGRLTRPTNYVVT